ncbi:WhiB family transcriptional regulator [Actinotignum sanguinis]|uniref:WhiB family transcriptional regulator n=1 Tax=Actinotignum TaxID=1653174 RepID=UPI0035D07248
MTTTLALYPHWADAAACAAIDPDSLFVRGAAQRQARSICFRCPVRLARSLREGEG